MEIFSLEANVFDHYGQISRKKVTYKVRVNDSAESTQTEIQRIRDIASREDPELEAHDLFDKLVGEEKLLILEEEQ